jgi:hypothetical protein
MVETDSDRLEVIMLMSIKSKIVGHGTLYLVDRYKCLEEAAAPIFRVKEKREFISLKMEVACSFEMVVPICHTIWLHIPEDYILNNYD